MFAKTGRLRVGYFWFDFESDRWRQMQAAVPVCESHFARPRVGVAQCFRKRVDWAKADIELPEPFDPFRDCLFAKHLPQIYRRYSVTCAWATPGSPMHTS